MSNEQMKKEAAACGAPYEKLGRVLVWHDEFDKGEIDFDKWSFVRTMREPDHEYDNSEKHIRVEDGKLHMQVHRSEKEGFTYSLSEGFTTDDTMLFKYGYLEARARVPYRVGAWPSFWCTSNTSLRESEFTMEVDIVEVWSSETGFTPNLHKWGPNWKHMALPVGNGWPNPTYRFENTENLINEYHTYGFEWDSEYMHFYVDDKKICTFELTGEKGAFGSDYFPETDMFQDWLRVIFNNEVFSQKSRWEASTPTLKEDSEMPIDYYVDYVRLYQNADKGEVFKTKNEIAAIVAAREAAKK